MKFLVLVSDSSSLEAFRFTLKVADSERDEIILFSAGVGRSDKNELLVQQGKQEGFMCSHIKSTGSVTDLLEKNIKDFKIDMVVLGFREVSAVQKALFGSISEYASQNASCSVMIVKKDGK